MMAAIKLKDMSIEEIANEVASMTYTDHRIVTYAVQEREEGIRIAEDVRSISRRRILSMGFAGVCGFAGLKGQFDIDEMSEALADEEVERLEKLQEYIKNPDSIAPESARSENEKESKENLSKLFNGIGLFVLAGVSGAISAFYSGRRSMHRSDIKQIADMNRRDVMIKALETFTTQPK